MLRSNLAKSLTTGCPLGGGGSGQNFGGGGGQNKLWPTHSNFWGGPWPTLAPHPPPPPVPPPLHTQASLRMHMISLDRVRHLIKLVCCPLLHAILSTDPITGTHVMSDDTIYYPVYLEYGSCYSSDFYSKLVSRWVNLK